MNTVILLLVGWPTLLLGVSAMTIPPPGYIAAKRQQVIGVIIAGIGMFNTCFGALIP